VIELDNNATTRPSPGVIEAVRRGMVEYWHNPSSVHRAGQAARHQVELSRQAVADLIGARPREITFTSGGTEAIDLAIRGTLAALPAGRQRLVTSKVEHAAVRDLGEELEKRGKSVAWCPLAPGGVIDLAALERLLTPDVGLVSIQWANNETGAIQPVREIAQACKARGVLFHCDATQWVGKMPTDVREIAFDVLTFAPHKFHGPKGVGVLWAGAGVRLSPRLLGTQELGRRGGTENVPGILGAGVAAREAIGWLSEASRREERSALRDQFEQTIQRAIPDAVINRPSDPAQRLWNTSNIGFPALEAEALLMLLSERGVAASAGAACSSGSLEPSPVLLAMGVPERVAHGSVRFSLSRETTRDEMEHAGQIVGECVARLRGSAASVI
jgi:cysteine desulfurase